MASTMRAIDGINFKTAPMKNTIPGGVRSYGILKQTAAGNEIERAAEEISTLGFTVLDSGLQSAEIEHLRERFNALQQQYRKKFGAEFLESVDEHNTIRLPLAFDSCFLDLATNRNVLSVVQSLILGKFILNQQNGIINPAGKDYNQAAWHRDLPYQHFVTSRAIAINALYCVDDFTLENGATHVLPASHKQEPFPSNEYILKHAATVVAPAGSFVVVDCMTFHRGGVNRSTADRRAVNHVYTIPHIKQQIDIPAVLASEGAKVEALDLLGYQYGVPRSIVDFLNDRKR